MTSTVAGDDTPSLDKFFLQYYELDDDDEYEDDDDEDDER